MSSNGPLQLRSKDSQEMERTQICFLDYQLVLQIQSVSMYKF